MLARLWSKTPELVAVQAWASANGSAPETQSPRLPLRDGGHCQPAGELDLSHSGTSRADTGTLQWLRVSL